MLGWGVELALHRLILDLGHWVHVHTLFKIQKFSQTLKSGK